MRTHDAQVGGSTSSLDARAQRCWIDVAFAALVLVTAGYRIWLARDSYYVIDDWLLLRQANAGQFLDPYNDHLSVLILALWRMLSALGGTSYVPILVVGTLAGAAVPAAVYVTVRDKLGPPVAALVGVVLLWSHTANLFAATLNHYLVLVAAAACALLLDRGRRADPYLAGGIVLAFLSAGGAVAVAAACIVHSACTRAPLRRWAAVLAPTALWLLWNLTIARGAESASTSVTASASDGPISLALDGVRYARDLFDDAIADLLIGWGAAGTVALIAFLAAGVAIVRKGLVHGANYLAWVAAMLVWSTGLIYSGRAEASAIFGTGRPLRYVLSLLVFAIFALLPRRPVRWSSLEARHPELLRRAPLVVGVVLVLFTGLRIATTVDATRDAADETTVAGRRAFAVVQLASGGPTVLPDDEQLGFVMGFLDAGQIREILARQGQDLERSGGEIDQALVDGGVVRTEVGPATDDPCARTSKRYKPGTSGTVVLRSDEASWTVSVRALGDEWIEVVDAQAGEQVTVKLPTGLAIPWLVRADGACAITPPR